MSKYCVDHFENQDTGYKIDVNVHYGGRYWEMETRDYIVANLWLDISGIERTAKFIDALQASGLRIADALRDERCKVSQMSGNKSRFHIDILFNGGLVDTDAIDRRLEERYQQDIREHGNRHWTTRQYYHYVQGDEVGRITVFNDGHGHLLEPAVTDLMNWMIKGLYELLNEAGVIRR